MSIVNVVIPDDPCPAVSPEVVLLHAPVVTPFDASVSQGWMLENDDVTTENGDKFGSNVALSKSYDSMTVFPHIDKVGAEDSVAAAVGAGDVVGFGDEVGDEVGPASHL